MLRPNNRPVGLWAPLDRGFLNNVLFGLDCLFAGAVLGLAVLLRYDFSLSATVLSGLPVPIFVFTSICAIVFRLSGMYEVNWRYSSARDLVWLVLTISCALAAFTLLRSIFDNLRVVPLSAIFITFFVLSAFVGASRFCFRWPYLSVLFRDQLGLMGSTETFVPILLIGAGDATDSYLRALERDRNALHRPVGILSIGESSVGSTLRGIRVLGTVDDFENVISDLRAVGDCPRHVVFTSRVSQIGKEVAEKLIDRADELGITASRLTIPTELRKSDLNKAFELRSITMTDLLERPQVTLDHNLVRRLVRHRKVLITGAGGSIGSELAKQIAALKPAELVLVENSEFNLYAIDQQLNEDHSDIKRSCYLCDITNARRLNAVFDCHKPELVFHAAALKHVPMVEQNPVEGARTNVLGTINVADAARRTNALAMVQVSTDKVVNACSIMGATKRLAELYCQSLDLEQRHDAEGTRAITVRFGNVLGSSGSIIPLFEKQLTKGGPLTIMDPEMRRFFMTIREAVELTLQASAHALEQRAGRGEIFVLHMGEPLRIIDVAHRMIRLAGYRPDVDVKIKIIGSRPGEKLIEELFLSSEERLESPLSGVLRARAVAMPLQVLHNGLVGLRQAVENGSEDEVIATLANLLPDYRGQRHVFHRRQQDHISGEHQAAGGTRTALTIPDQVVGTPH